ncbi:MAG: hypothetical protein WCS16_02150 [Desulfuromonas sp.]
MAILCEKNYSGSTERRSVSETIVLNGGTSCATIEPANAMHGFMYT